MKNKLKVEIIIPFVEGQKKGDINYIEKKVALKYEKEGLVKIIPTSSIKIPEDLFFKKGFQVVRLKEEVPEAEILVYNSDTKEINQYSVSRAISILEQELQTKQFNIKEYAINECGVDEEKFKVHEFIGACIKKESKLLAHLIFMPTDQRIITRNNKKYFNVYNKSKLLKSAEQQKAKGNKGKESPIMKEYFSHLVDHDSKSREYLNKFFAWKIQNPLKRIPINLVIVGAQGSGKSTLKETFSKPIFGDNTTSINMSTLNKNSDTTFMLGTELLICEEVMNNENKAEMPHILKNLGADETITINRMRKAPLRDTPNFCNLILFSNHPNPIHLEQWDRRYPVFKQLKKIPKQLAFRLYNKLQDELEDHIIYLLNLKVTRDELEKIPETQARKDLISINMDTIEAFLKDCVENGKILDYLIKYNPQAKYNFEKIIDVPWIQADCAYKAYCAWCQDTNIKHPFTRNRFYAQLSFKGYEKKVVKINGESANSLSILNNFNKDIPRNDEKKQYSEEDMEAITINVVEDVS